MRKSWAPKYNLESVDVGCQQHAEEGEGEGDGYSPVGVMSARHAGPIKGDKAWARQSFGCSHFLLAGHPGIQVPRPSVLREARVLLVPPPLPVAVNRDVESPPI